METILVTGGNGKIGSEIIRHLNDHGYQTVSVDIKRGPDEADTAMKVDLTDGGETYGAFTRADPDAVIHMGTIPNAGKHPDHVVYENNAMSAYHVLEAASALDIGSVCMASSIQAMGTSAPQIEYLPVDEDHHLTPQDPYELGKQALEELADGFARRSGHPQMISTFRFPSVQTRDEIRERLPEGDGAIKSLGDGGRSGLFAYVDVADVADLVRRALEANFDGHERFWVSAPDTRTNLPTENLVTEFYPDAELRADLTGNDPLIDTGKARELIGWEPETSWRTLST